MSSQNTNSIKITRAHQIFYIGTGVLYAVLIGGWLSLNIETLSIQGQWLISVGKLFGLMAGFSVLLQVFLMSRVPLVDQRFNLHEIVQLHRWNGYAVVTSIALHILFITLGYAALSETGLRNQFIELVTSYQDVFKALIGAGLIYFAFALSIGFARRRVSYETWYYIHLTMYVAIALIFFHQINIGSDLIGDSWFKYYWLGLYLLAFGFLLYYRAFRIILLAIKHDFKIQKVLKEADGIYSIYIEGRGIKDFTFDPGQYAGWRIITPTTSFQSHPYSFSSLPGQDTVRFTINEADGSFTKSIPSIKAGTRVLIDGPRGSFTAKRAATTEVVLIAGGIGVAPFISLVPDLLQNGYKVHLLYAARTAENIAFRRELDTYVSQGLNLETYISSEGKRIDSAALSRYGTTDTTYYLCGPPPMIEGLTATLKELNIPSSLIVTERFSI